MRYDGEMDCTRPHKTLAAVMRWLGVALACLLLVACRAPWFTSTEVREPSPAPCEASIRIVSTPSDALVLFNDKERGRTPLTLRTTAQQGTLRLEKEGYETAVILIVPQCARELVVSRTLRDVASPEVALASIPGILAPEDGLEIAATAQDNDVVAEMILRLGGESLHQVAGPYLRYEVDTSQLAEGKHTFTVEAVDGAGNVGTAQCTFRLLAPTATEEPRAAASPTATQTEPLRPTATATPKPEVPAVLLRWDELTIDTYAYEEALYTAPEEVGHPYPLLDRGRVGPPRPRTYRVLTMCNEYLELTLLPALGGRIYQCRFLPTEQALFYNNEVIKPTHWGPADQGWWMAVGGMEFCLPVDEHGYVTAEPWETEIKRYADGSATVTMHIQEQSRHIEARVSIILRPQKAAFTVYSTLRNASASQQEFQYWINAMLAPGAHSVRPSLRFYYPTSEVIVHSTGDESLPDVDEPLAWPVYQGRDLSHYAQWRDWLGFFAPNVEAPFTAVYEPTTQLGMVRIFPPQTARGSKLFGFGPQHKYAENYTDDGSSYVEMWGGLTSTFGDYATLEPGEAVAYEETWYPIVQCGGVSFANQEVALHAVRDGGDLEVSLFSPVKRTGTLQIAQGQRKIAVHTLTVRPEAPCTWRFEGVGNMGPPLTILVLDGQDTLIASHTF
ncbi:MAG: DUF5107 domain-containing protein [Chloroflexota bacterium]|nr:DUF5107 domain-containing protein [Chloroflexota bacterium]